MRAYGNKHQIWSTQKDQVIVGRELLSLLYTLKYIFHSKHKIISGKTVKRELEIFQVKKTGHVLPAVVLHLPASHHFHTESTEQNHSEARHVKTRQKTNCSAGCMIPSLQPYRGTNRKMHGKMHRKIPERGSRGLGFIKSYGAITFLCLCTTLVLLDWMLGNSLWFPACVETTGWRQLQIWGNSITGKYCSL